MEVKWGDALMKAAEEIMIKGGSLEFIVYKRQPNKRKAVIRKYPQNEINCDEEEIID